MVSFIILNYNSSNYCLQCVTSINQQLSKVSYEVIVVDNFSHEEDKNYLKRNLPSDVRLVESRFNGGFGLGNMLGANVAKGDFLCFINSDIIFVEDCVTPLITYMHKHPEVGCITPQQMSSSQERVASFLHNPGLLRELFGNHFLEKLAPKHFPRQETTDSTPPLQVPQVTGCFMLFPTDVFWAIGGFDTNIFLYCEEYDVGNRLRTLKKTCMVLPQFCFIHIGAVTTKKVRGNADRERFISRLYVYRKHHPLWLSTMYRIVMFLKYLMRPKRWNLLPILFRGEALSRSMRFHACQNTYTSLKQK